MSSGHFLRGETLVRGFPILRYGQVSAIVRFVLMPDGHLLTLRFATDKFHQHSHFAHGSCSLDGSPRSPLTIPENGPFEIPFRTVGNYPENDIAFFEIATNQHRQAKRSLPEGSLSAPESLTP